MGRGTERELEAECNDTPIKECYKKHANKKQTSSPTDS